MITGQRRYEKLVKRAVREYEYGNFVETHVSSLFHSCKSLKLNETINPEYLSVRVIRTHFSLEFIHALITCYSKSYSNVTQYVCGVRVEL